YPNPERSHFEAMDIWQSADPKRTAPTGWLGRAAVESDTRAGGVPILHVGARGLPLAVAGAPGGGAVSVNDQNSFRLDLGTGNAKRQQARRQLMGDLWAPAGKSGDEDLISFVQRRQVQTLTAVENLRELLQGPNAVRRQGFGALQQKLQLIAALIARGF